MMYKSQFKKIDPYDDGFVVQGHIYKQAILTDL